MRPSFPLHWIKIASIPWLLGCLFIAVPSLAQTAGSDSESEERTLTLQSSENEIENQASFSYSVESNEYSGVSNLITNLGLVPLTDPRGQVLGCGGELLPDYTGFSVALYDIDPTDPTESELGPLLRLTQTEVPNVPGNNIPLGITPNINNDNPFNLTNEDEGLYSFLLDRALGQLDVGDSYILVVDPPAGTPFQQRRVRLTILEVKGFGNGDREQVRYLATSLDGEPIGVEGAERIDQSVVLIEDADRVGLQLLALQFENTLCDANQLDISKTGDRANAAPGDSVIYRLVITNRSDVALDNIVVNDILPLGFKFINSTVQAGIGDELVPISARSDGLNITFTTPIELAVNESLAIIYAAQLTPDAKRGDGINSATTRGQRVDNDFDVSNGPATHQVRISSGALSNCGTILGRVFEDKNYDGEQQTGEPGIPYAVVWMDDGNRITTDQNGLFHVKCVLPGHRTGAIDLDAIPGYELAPNTKFIERNSPSRLVRLSPGGLARMNFGVIPSTEEEQN